MPRVAMDSRKDSLAPMLSWTLRISEGALSELYIMGLPGFSS